MLQYGGRRTVADMEPDMAPEAAKRYILGQVPHLACAPVTHNVPSGKGRQSLPFKIPLRRKVLSLVTMQEHSYPDTGETS